MNEAEREYMSRVPYANVVGSLMYVMICTRPDISHAIRVVSRYMHDLGKEHWQAVKGILRYIRNTVDVRLILSRKIVSIWLDIVTWIMQSTDALSTTEVEYMSIMEAVKDAI
ncbi:secreted RxLR effector protein 161-like [Nicotiana sylvestris]|uniref:secreted RxLR effector protein 161-like n=1 Tax=Nicotiana sylvestris TaxID=4096 RepID=UPI00388C9F1F